jgi:hypothetical protein
MKKLKILLVEAQLIGFKRYKDLTVGYTFRSLNEVSQDEFKLTDQYYQNTGNMAFKLDEITATEIPEGTSKREGTISPSQYLRTRLFAKHMFQGGTKETFPPYYERAMYGFAEAVDNSYERS